jgi:Flp pilus assembly protein TadD
LAALFLLSGATFFAVRGARRFPYFLTGWLWYLGTLFPVNGLVVIGPHARADRYTYIPLIGLFLIFAWGVPDLFPKRPHRKAALALLASASLVFFGVLAWVQTGFWKNGITLYEHTLSVTEKNWVVHTDLGTLFFNRGETDKALFHFREASSIRPDIAKLHFDVGMTLSKLGRTGEAISEFQKAVRVDPHFSRGYMNMGLAWDKLSEYGRAQACLLEAVRQDPESAEAHHALGVEFDRLGQTEKAEAQFREALRLKPDFASARCNMGVICLRQGKIRQAVAQFKLALADDPDFPEAKKGLAIALSMEGDISKNGRTGK